MKTETSKVSIGVHVRLVLYSLFCGPHYSRTMFSSLYMHCYIFFYLQYDVNDLSSFHITCTFQMFWSLNFAPVLVYTWHKIISVYQKMTLVTCCVFAALHESWCRQNCSFTFPNIHVIVFCNSTTLVFSKSGILRTVNVVAPWLPLL